VVRADIGFVRYAAHSGKRVEDENRGGIGIRREVFALDGIFPSMQLGILSLK
jgi:hypothetical protein